MPLVTIVTSVTMVFSEPIRIEDVLHVEVSSGVDGVQQGPLVIEWIVMLQFTCDGSERFYHDILSLVQTPVVP